MDNFLITVNNQEIPVTKTEAENMDCIAVNDTNFHLLYKHQGYKVEVLQSDFLAKTLKISVNGNIYDVAIEDEYDLQVKKMGLLATTAVKVNEIKAPMPGLIIDILVKAGQAVTEGTPLLVLSAMKMENVILSQGEGVVKNIAVKKDDAVEKGQLIIEME